MRTSNKTIMVVLGVGAVLVLAGQALAQGRAGFRSGSEVRSQFSRGYSGGYRESNRHFTRPHDSPRSFHGRSSFGYAKSPHYYAAPRAVTPWWCGMNRPVYVAPRCSMPRPVPSYYPSRRYEHPTWRYCR